MAEQAMTLGESYVYDSTGRARPAPDSWWGDGLGALLSRVAERYDRAGVLVLTRRACELLGLPLEQLPRGGDPSHPAIQDAARAGWTAKAVCDWTHWYGEGRPGIHVALEPALDLSRDKDGVPTHNPWWCSLQTSLGAWASLLDESTAALARWHQLAGSPWHGEPGMAGLTVMKTLAPQRGGRIPPPTWVSAGVVLPEDEAAEDDWRMSQYRGDKPAGRIVHGYDVNRAYIAAAAQATVCPWGLKHTGRTEWTSRLAGWWKVELPHEGGKLAWNSPLPYPAGYLPDDPPIRWVTGPTMALLTELTKEGIFGGARVIDSYTGPARDYPLRPWGAKLRDVYAAGHQLADTPTADAAPGIDHLVGVAITRMSKLAGRKTLGALASSTNWAYRPDWWYSVVALHRANLWRKIRRTWDQDHRLPVGIDVDCAYYASDDEDPAAHVPSGFRWDPTGLQIGAVKPKPQRERVKA